MLTKEFDFFTNNHKQLFEKFPNEYLIIQGENVLFHSDTLNASLDWAIRNDLKQGEFMLQLCSAGEKAYTHTFHSRVIFA